MKGILIIIIAFVVGVSIGRFSTIDLTSFSQEYSMYILYVMMILVGMSVGHDTQRLKMILRPDPKLLLVPVGTITGTLLGVLLISLFVNRPLLDSLAVGSGFGYYSLSSLLIAEYKGAELGTIALLSNILRELITIIGAPLLVMWFGPLAPISSGGATTMDSTLPAITRYSGSGFVIASLLHGMLVDLSVPFLVSLFCTL